MCSSRSRSRPPGSEFTREDGEVDVGQGANPAETFADAAHFDERRCAFRCGEGAYLQPLRTVQCIGHGVALVADDSRGDKSKRGLDSGGRLSVKNREEEIIFKVCLDQRGQMRISLCWRDLAHQLLLTTPSRPTAPQYPY